MALFGKKGFGFSRSKKQNIPDGLWIKCPACGQTTYKTEVEENQEVCPNCGHHYRLGARKRIGSLVDEGSFQETNAGLQTADPLGFAVGKETYPERIERARKQSGVEEAMITGFAAIEGTRVAIGAMDPAFVMASMGSVVGEKFCRLAEDAIQEGVPLVVCAASGGARMQEGILALMQMAKTSDAVRALNDAGIPYIVIQTDATTGGVYASFASLGDITIAEPKAYIGFAGARLIEGALKVKLPEGFQRSEYQFDNGFVDKIVPRSELRLFLAKVLSYIAPEHRAAAKPSKAASVAHVG